MAGSMGGVGESKIARMRAHAVSQRIPFVWLLDSAGAEAVEERTGRVTWFGLDDGGDVYAFFPYDTDGPDRLLTRARRAVRRR